MHKWDIDEELTEIQYLTYSLLLSAIHLESEYGMFPNMSGTAGIIIKMLDRLQEGLSDEQAESALTN